MTSPDTLQNHKHRRRKKPWAPGKDAPPPEVRAQLGLPSLERAQHSRFDEVNLTPSSPPPGVKRARVKSLFHDIDDRASLIEFALADLKLRGIIDKSEEDIELNGLTSIDKNFSYGELGAISWFAPLHAKIEGGQASIVNYSGTSGERNNNKLPMSEEEFQNRAEYAHVVSKLPEAFLVFLDWVARSKYPQYFSDGVRVPGKVQFSASMFDASEQKYLRGGADGYFKAVTQAIEHSRAEYRTIMQRRRLINGGYRHHRLKGERE